MLLGGREGGETLACYVSLPWNSTELLPRGHAHFCAYRYLKSLNIRLYLELPLLVILHG